MKSAINLHTQGKNLQGRPWLSYNSMTQRMEFMYVKRQFREEMQSSWSLRKEEFNVDSGAGSVAYAGASNPEPAQTPPPKEPEKEQVAPKQAIKRGQKQQRATKENEDNEEDIQEQQEAKRIKKETDLAFAKARKLKGRMESITACTSDLLDLIDGGAAEWSWAAHAKVSEPIRTATKRG